MFNKINVLRVYLGVTKYLNAIKVSKYSQFLYLVSCLSVVIEGPHVKDTIIGHT